MSAAAKRFPFGLLVLAAVCLAGHGLSLRCQPARYADSVRALPDVPSQAAMRALTLDNPVLAARLMLVYLQSFELRPGYDAAIRRLDYDRLIEWLTVAQQLDPTSRYPALLAAYVYAPAGTADQARRMTGFIHRSFLENPARRWDALAQAALLARHRLGDLPLALKYAQTLAEHTAPGQAPAWARQLPLFVLQQMGEQEAALALLEALVVSGELSDPAEVRFLLERLVSPGSADS